MFSWRHIRRKSSMTDGIRLWSSRDPPMLEHINQFTVANDVRMRRATFKGAFLLVEGRSDQKLYVKFTNASQTQVVVCRTKDDVVAAIQTLDVSNFVGVLAII